MDYFNKIQIGTTVVNWLRHDASSAGQETKAPHAAEHGQRKLKKKKKKNNYDRDSFSVLLPFSVGC